ncbi:polysaccharide deacetylase family protein [Sphingobacterium griseoflavum]|uniref:Polysaccharide deacetylase n=1 Tax=Sphingobacterium griseoflavum TaxID=1474952 RepID=A0ABQ3HPU1_9SPHI|nr:polysaccharide deacetylase family protein [Sphingobacterium griseoflavum]GHE23139.1 polysaccharide deacetylase [Sphingobacterium griseoflavum]
MYFVNAPFFLRWLYPKVTFNRSRKDKVLYLTFDDGPIPEITPFILDTLASYQIKGTFFCVGDNINKYPDLFHRTQREGHQVANHTYNHLKGWNTRDDAYLANIAECEELTKTSLFRPPYGRAKKSQLRRIYPSFEVVFWDVLSGDFDTKLSPEECFRNVVKHSKNGSIIVFHDNIKAIPRIRYTLPKAIEYFQSRGFTFDVLRPAMDI